MSSKRTIHFVYTFGPQKSCPQAIGNELTRRLEGEFNVIQHRWNSDEVVYPSSGDILLGHPYYSPSKCFYRSLKNKGWARVIGMWPFSSGDLTHSAFQDRVIRSCDLFLLITGPYYFKNIGNTIYQDWLPKVRHLDLGVNRADFPILKQKFNPVPQRKFVYIGSKTTYKNLPYLSDIALANPHLSFSWIGSPKDTAIPGVASLGYVDFQTQEGRELVSQFDFLITVGKSDANPTTILESMAWGLIPICTPQSGYDDSPGILNIPLNDVESASRIINDIHQRDEISLQALQQINWQALDSHFNWDRFARDVIEAIESTESPRIKSDLRRRAILYYYSLVAPWDSTPFNRISASLKQHNTMRRLIKRLINGTSSSI
jgi:hypothetical protein